MSENPIVFGPGHTSLMREYKLLGENETTLPLDELKARIENSENVEVAVAAAIDGLEQEMGGVAQNFLVLKDALEKVHISAALLEPGSNLEASIEELESRIQALIQTSTNSTTNSEAISMGLSIIEEVIAEKNITLSAESARKVTLIKDHAQSIRGRIEEVREAFRVQINYANSKIKAARKKNQG
jgi:hypothetical protein